MEGIISIKSFFLFLDMVFPFSYAFFLENIDLYLPNNNEFPITVTELITILISQALATIQRF